MAEELDAITRTYDLILWALDRVESFPKAYRVRLGDRMQDTMYATLDRLIEAKYAPRGQKVPALTQANLLLERLRFQGRIACDKQCISRNQHGHLAKLVNEAGMSVGGWIKDQKRARTAAGAGALVLFALALGALML